jgi:hypothetical protein
VVTRDLILVEEVDWDGVATDGVDSGAGSALLDAGGSGLPGGLDMSSAEEEMKPGISMCGNDVVE